MPKRENTPQEPLRKPELIGAASATESSPAGAGDPPELGILVEALIEGAKSRPDSAFEDHALAELAALPDDAYAAARERLAGAGVDLGRLDEAMLAYAVDAGAGPALSDSFGKALDPKLPEADRELVLAAETDPGAPFTEPHQGTLKLAWADPARKARLRARPNYIHPFTNGNGRTARAACYFVLCVKTGGWLGGRVILPARLRSNRDEYVKALRSADAVEHAEQPDLAALRGLILRLLAEQLDDR